MRHIPSNAKNVFKGILFDVYQWEQELFDGSTTTFEMLERQPMADVIAVTPEEKILVLRERQPGTDWFPSLPGGHIERGEDPLLGVQRELLEETGYTAETWKHLWTYTHHGKIYCPIHVYVARHCQKIQELTLDGGEEIEVHSYSFEDFLSLCRDPRFNAPMGLKFMLYEALLEPRLRQDLYNTIFSD